MLETILATIVVAFVTAVMGIITKAVVDWSAREKAKAETQKESLGQYDAIRAIEVGVAKAQQQIVDSAKAAAADGKITKEELKSELKHAENVARNTALEIATGPALEFLTQLTVDSVGGLIDLVLQRNK